MPEKKHGGKRRWKGLQMSDAHRLEEIATLALGEIAMTCLAGRQAGFHMVDVGGALSFKSRLYYGENSSPSNYYIT